MSKIKEKIYYKIKFKLAEPLSVGSGLNNQTDSDVIVDKIGKPYIPGSSIAGVCSSLFDEKTRKKYFGFVEISTSASMSSSSRKSDICFYDALLCENTRFEISNRNFVALDECKVSIEGSKFDREVVEPGAAFVTYIEVNVTDDNEDIKNVAEKIISAWDRNTLHFGAKTMRGLGAICKTSISIKVFNFTDKVSVNEYIKFDMFDGKTQWDSLKIESESDDNVEISLSLQLKLMGAISVREYTTEVSETEAPMPDYKSLTVSDEENAVKENPVVPGASWAGAFLHRLRELEPDIDWGNLFGMVTSGEKKKSRIRFSETVIRDTTPMVMTRTAVDRFSGGAVDGALYTERTYYGNSDENKSDAALNICIKDYELTEGEISALAATIADLNEGILSVGGLTSVGRGIFKIKSINGEEVASSEEVFEFVKEILKKGAV